MDKSVQDGHGLVGNTGIRVSQSSRSLGMSDKETSESSTAVDSVTLPKQIMRGNSWRKSEIIISHQSQGKEVKHLNRVMWYKYKIPLLTT
jgi:hypothetical protein